MTTPDHTKDGLVSFSYFCPDLNQDLTCWFEHEAAELGARSRSGEQLEPDYPATFSLYHVYLPGSAIDLAPVLSAEVIESIEGWVADEAESVAQDAEDDFEIDRYIDSKDY